MPENITVQVLSLNIALFIFNFFLLQLILKRLSDLYNLKKGLSTKPEQVLVDANKNANQIVLTAVNKAEEIISHTEISSKNISTAIDASIEQLVNKGVQKIDSQLEKFEGDSSIYLKQLTEKLGQNMSNLTNMLEKKAEVKVDEMFDKFEDKTENSYTNIHNNLIQEYENALTQINSYKEDKNKEIDTRVLTIIKNITKQVLPSTFSDKLNEELVLESIRKAKRDHVLY